MFCFLCKQHKIFNITPFEQFMRGSSNIEILSSLKYRDKSLYFILKKCMKRNLSEMTSYLRHIAQHTGLSKRKFEIQIPYYWLICQHCLVFTKCSTQHRVPLGKYFFLVLSSSLKDNLLEKVQSANCFGLLTAEVTCIFPET